MEAASLSAGGGHLAAKPSDDDDGVDVDGLSALPNNVLLHILVGLGDAAAAGRTSVLSSRWRRLWALLPELRFPVAPEPRMIDSALAAHEADLRHLDVGTQDAAPDPLAAWLRVAARRLSGVLVFANQVPPGRDGDGGDGDERGAFELPCLDKATSVSLDLGFLGIIVPRAGVFARLAEISLSHARFPRPCALGDAVSSRRCPCLQKLVVNDTRGLDDLTVRSDSLRHVELNLVRGLQQLAIVAPALEHLQVLLCFYDQLNRRPVANISAPQLKVLKWGDLFDRRSVQLGKMKHLRAVCPDMFHVYGPLRNQPCAALLQCFNTIPELSFTVVYPPDINNRQCLLKDMKMLPSVMYLHLSVISNGHAFGVSLFHVLRLCSTPRKLTVRISRGSLEEQTACMPGCVCDEQQDWKFQELLLNHLQEVKIKELRGSEHEVIFLKHLFKWATVLRKMTVTFNSLVTESMARKLHRMLQRFSRPEICMDFYMVKDTMKVLYVPED